jgi:hypothetical protein
MAARSMSPRATPAAMTAIHSGSVRSRGAGIVGAFLVEVVGGAVDDFGVEGVEVAAHGGGGV